MVKPLDEDTVLDKLIRFVVGAVVGGAAFGFSAIYWEWDPSGMVTDIVIGCVVGGLGGVVFGNRFIEGMFQ